VKNNYAWLEIIFFEANLCSSISAAVSNELATQICIQTLRTADITL